ncbi:hypothetical protein FQN49_004556 [Arthroderma sp. PD_2]|nr:hypothetical protein FQN49_004556 [Arthroderma sp. PD_2]
MDILGATCLLCSRLREAYELHKEAIEKLSNLEGFGPEHEHTLVALNNLSRVELRYFHHEEAFKMQLQAYGGLKRVLGPTHLKTLDAKENFAGIHGFMGEQHLPPALQMSEEVVQIRIKTLGREHPLTLRSKLIVAKIKTAMNQFDEAEQIFLEGLPAAERNLGENHLGTLAARTWLGHLYWRQGRYLEAQAILEDVMKKQRYELSRRADGEHIDRVQAMWFLVHCYEDQGKIDDALNMCQDVTQLVHNFGGEGLGRKHKLCQNLKEKREELLTLKEHNAADTLPSGSQAYSSAIPPKKVVKDFTF